MDITRMVMIPIKWAAELVDRNATPLEFAQIIEHKTSGWDTSDGEYHDYLLT